MAAEDAQTLDPERHRRLCAAFDALYELAPAARAAALDALRDSAPELIEELQAMLAASARPELQGTPSAPELPADLAAARGYRVLREIGRGGMGRVLLAERADGRFQRQVAIKVIDRSPDDPDWRRRFLAERDILARLVHPHIVRLLDAGESAGGVPYLVMEYVDGEPLDRYLRAQQPNLTQRLALFQQIAAAVAYAHQMLVAHRDIKPANVLVDRGGMPHLLDFGIARLLSEQAATATGTRALTPRYAAPEQVAGTPGTAALDVYQLGVLLYELLCGEPPFAQLEGPALLRAVLEQDPPSPERLARMRGRADARRIDADLAAICLRALRKEPTQRYASVDALLADLERWQRGEPVRASAGGWTYRSRKFLRRHWRAASVGVFLLVLTAGFVWRLNQELARSERERAVAVQATELITDVFGQADPSRAQGEELTLREALDQSVERLRATDLPDSVRARVLESVGATYLELSRQNQAIPLLGEAADAYRRAGELDSQLRALHGQAIAMQDLGKYAEAQAAIEAVVAMRTAEGLHGDAFEAELHSSLANLHQYQRRQPQALAEFDQALAILRTMKEPDQAQLAHTLRNLGDIRTSQGDVEGGRAALLEAQQLIERLYGPDHPDSIRLLRGLGRNAQRRRAYDEALEDFKLGWERAQRVFPPPHLVRTLLAHPLALAYLHRGDLREAEALMRQARSEAEALYPPQHPSRATLDNDLALILGMAGQYAAARPLALAAKEVRVAIGDEDSAIAQPELILAVIDCGVPAETLTGLLDRMRADRAVSPVMVEDYIALATRCPR